MRHSLAAEGVDTRGLHSVPGTLTSQATVIVDQHGDRLVVPFHDPCVDKSPAWLPLTKWPTPISSIATRAGSKAPKPRSCAPLARATFRA